MLSDPPTQTTYAPGIDMTTSVRVFLNYRRDDTEGYAGRLRDSLVSHFGEHGVFMDVAGIDPGDDFVEEIHRQVASCDVLIAMIGRHWLTVTDRHGRRRLDDPQDFVRLEIEAALARGVRVIPVLVQKASMPSADELPDTLAPLARRNAMEMTASDWADQVGRLVRAIEKARSRTPSVATLARSTAPPRPKQATVDAFPTGHPVDLLTFAPDGRRLASAGAGFVEIWDLSGGGPLAASGYEASLVYALEFSPDGELVAAGHNDGSARLLDAQTGEAVVAVKRSKRVYDVAFSARGHLLATAHDDRTARLWDLPSGKARSALRHDNVVYAVAFPNDDSQLLTATGVAGRAPVDGAVRLWSTATTEVVTSFGYPGARGWFNAARFSRDGTRVAVLSSESRLMLLDVADATLLEEIPGVAYGDTIAMEPTGALAVAWTTGGASAYASDGHETRLGPEAPVRAVALDPSGSLAATADEDGVIHLWSLR